MISRNPSVDKYLGSLPDDRRDVMSRMRNEIVENLPEGFAEVLDGSPNYIVPLSVFPDGYHCTPDTPLPFMGINSLKGHVALNHFGMYVDQKLLQWFEKEYPKHVSRKLDMGKSCVRFKKLDDIPYRLIGQLAAQRTVDEWVNCYKEVLS